MKKYTELMKRYAAFIILSPLFLSVAIMVTVDFIITNTLGRFFNWAAEQLDKK